MSWIPQETVLLSNLISVTSAKAKLEQENSVLLAKVDQLEKELSQSRARTERYYGFAIEIRAALRVLREQAYQRGIEKLVEENRFPARKRAALTEDNFSVQRKSYLKMLDRLSASAIRLTNDTLPSTPSDGMPAQAGLYYQCYLEMKKLSAAFSAQLAAISPRL